MLIALTLAKKAFQQRAPSVTGIKAPQVTFVHSERTLFLIFLQSFRSQSLEGSYDSKKPREQSPMQLFCGLRPPPPPFHECNAAIYAFLSCKRNMINCANFMPAKTFDDKRPQIIWEGEKKRSDEARGKARGTREERRGEAGGM